MNKKINLQTILIVFMVCVTVIVSTNSYANAQAGGATGALINETTEGGAINVEPVVPGGPGFIMVSAFDFRPYYSFTPWAYFGVSLYNPKSTTDFSYMEAGLTLPHGVKINKVTVFYFDNSASDFNFNLCKVSVNGVTESIEYLSSTGASTDYQYISQTVESLIIDNQNFSYYLEVGIPPGGLTTLRISNVRIDYDYTVYTPAIMK